MAKTVEIIAEIGINHGGNLDKAHFMIEESARVGANTIKFQMVNPDLVYEPDSELYQIFKRSQFSMGDWIMLKRHTEKLGLKFLCTPGEKESAEALRSLGVDRFKIASDSAFNLDFVNYVMSFGKPVIVSMGQASSLDEIKRTLKQYNTMPAVLMHCVSLYPPQPQDLSLNWIDALQALSISDLEIGYSDHMPWIESALVAVVKGASVIEKHIKATDQDIDAPVSLSFTDFESMVKSIRKLEQIC